MRHSGFVERPGAGGDYIHVASQGGEPHFGPHPPSLLVSGLVGGMSAISFGLEAVHYLQVHPIPLPPPVELPPQALLNLDLYRVVYVPPELLGGSRPLSCPVGRIAYTLHLHRLAPVVLVPEIDVSLNLFLIFMALLGLPVWVDFSVGLGDITCIDYNLPADSIHSLPSILAAPHVPYCSF